VLDKGVVIDAWLRVSIVGIDLVTVEARVVVASCETYLKHAQAMGLTRLSARPVEPTPQTAAKQHDALVAENAALSALLAARKGSEAVRARPVRHGRRAVAIR
jgi:hypothetical protein